jgi:hypothetical protein
MSLTKPIKDEFELGFTTPAAGTYLWQFTTDIQKMVKEGPGRSILIPMQIIEIISGDAEAIMGKTNEFVTIITKEGAANKKGEETIGMFLDYTGLYDKAMEKFGEGVDLVSDAFVAWLNINLPGKTIKADHDIKKDNKNREQVQFRKFYRATASTTSSAPAAKFE